uniref:Uncharacterized protein n=1 Tax=viral metagenome TaxID=1070528 RepID=A0A6M3LI21_9ZZZZ
MINKKAISLWKFKQIMVQLWKQRDGATGMRVQFYLNGTEVYLDSIGQFGVVPDVTIYLKEKE